jgi:8-oxo-dGTP pyrophosphatase MutT (NUDIX family)
MQNPWTTLSSEEKYDNPWITVTEHQVLNPKGGPGIYGVVHFKNLAIGILPVYPDGTTLLVGQYRYPLNAYSWEIPEGGGKLGVPPQQSAERELLEETGLKASRLQEILRMHLSNSVSDELAIVYLATGLTQHEAEPEDTEQLSLRRVSLAQAFHEVIDGQITDSITVAALLRVYPMWAAGELQA